MTSSISSESAQRHRLNGRCRPLVWSLVRHSVFAQRSSGRLCNPVSSRSPTTTSLWRVDIIHSGVRTVQKPGHLIAIQHEGPRSLDPLHVHTDNQSDQSYTPDMAPDWIKLACHLGRYRPCVVIPRGVKPNNGRVIPASGIGLRSRGIVATSRPTSGHLLALLDQLLQRSGWRTEARQ